MSESIANIINGLDGFIRKNNKLLFVLVIALIITQFFWLNYSNWQTGDISNGLHGIKHWLDTDRYTGGAEKLLNGNALIGREMQFVGYMLVIAFTKLLNLPILSVVVIQIIFAFVSALALFDISRQITNSKIAGLVAFGLYLCNPFIVSWHMYILTESLYTSFVILSLWCLLKLLETKKIIHLSYSIPVLILTILIRPNGWILLPVWIIVLVIGIPKQRKWKLFFSVSVIIIFIFSMASVGLFNKSIQITTPVENLKKGITVWGHEELNLNMPQDEDIDDSKWTNGIKYIARHPIPCIKLAAYRMGYTLIHVRPFHSTKYKLLVLIWIIPAYFLALIGIISYRKDKQILVSLAYIIAHLFIVAVSYAEHDSRFDIYILPIFYLLAGTGTFALLKHIKRRLLTSLY